MSRSSVGIRSLAKSGRNESADADGFELNPDGGPPKVALNDEVDRLGLLLDALLFPLVVEFKVRRPKDPPWFSKAAEKASLGLNIDAVGVPIDECARRSGGGDDARLGTGGGERAGVPTPPAPLPYCDVK